MRCHIAAAVLVVLAGSAFAQPSCPAPQTPMLDIELLLGRGKADNARWKAFLAHEVTPRFPDGLTVYQTTGQWRDPATHKVAREKSRVLRILVRPICRCRIRSTPSRRPTRSGSRKNLLAS